MILITTKRGSKGAPKFNMNYTFTLQQPTRLPTFLGSYDHAVLRNESLANDGARPAFTEEDIEHYRLGDSPYTHPDNDYVKDFLRKTTPMHKLNVNVRGGTDNVRYYVALSRTLAGRHLPAVRRQIPFERQFQTHQPPCEPRLFADEDHRTESRPQRTSRPEAEQQSGPERQFDLLDDVRNAPMSYPYRLPDGSYGASTDNEAENLMAMLSDWGYSRLASNILEGTVKLHQKLDFVTKGLSVRGMVSFNSYYDDGTKVSYRPPTYRYVSDTEKVIAKEETAPSISSLSGKGHRRRTNIEVGINYNRDLRRPCRNGDGGIHADQGEYQRRASAGLSGVCGPCDLRL